MKIGLVRLSELSSKPVLTKILRGVFLCGLIIIIFGLEVDEVFAETRLLEQLEITTDTTWNLAGSPYILQTITDPSFPVFVRVMPGATLTIEPGVVVKFEERTQLDIRGVLHAVGTTEEPIHFTSSKNDALGGDTNGDGDVTTPSPFDSWGISIRNGNGLQELKHVNISYLSNGITVTNPGDLLITNLKLEQAIGSFLLIDQNTKVSNLELIGVNNSISVNSGEFEGSNLMIDNTRCFSIGCTNAAITFHSFAQATVTDSTLAKGVLVTDSVLNLVNTAIIGGEPGDNIGIDVSGPTAKLVADRVTVTNFANRGISLFNNNFEFTNGVISNNGYGVLANSAQATITDSIIADNNFGIFNTVNLPILATNNWWGDATGPHHPNTNPDGLGNTVSSGVLFDPWLGQDPNQPEINPVIIIPGILGSWEKDGVWVIDPILHVYDNLIDTLAANGYTAGVDLFTFPYDWRNSNVLTAINLRLKIDEVKAICQCDQVDLVAHSMGGLVAREYIQSDKYQDDVDQLIFLGTPHLGSLKSYLMWEGGETGFSIQDRVLKIILELERFKNGFDSLFDYVRNRPIISVSELLPVFDYLKDADTEIIRSYPNNYPANQFLEDLNNNLSSLINSGVNITNIIGNAGSGSTISIIKATESPNSNLWEHGYPEGFNEKVGDRGLELGNGDGTVTENSSSFISNDLNIINSSHRSIPDEAKLLIYNKLTGRDPNIIIDDFKIPNLRVLIISIESPADIKVIAPDGKMVGKNFETGEEYNETPDAFYSGFLTDKEFITIPNPLDGEYRVITQGIDNGGEYTIVASYISETDLVTTETLGLTTPGQVTEINVKVNNANPEDLETERVVTLEILISDINKAYELGWISQDKVKDGLIKQAERIMKFEQKRNGKFEKKVDKIIIKLLEKELDFLLKKERINQQAYNLLKMDLSYIINNN